MNSATTRSRTVRRRALAGLLPVGLMLSIAALALVAPLLPIPAPASTDFANLLSGPSSEHLLGTDHLGRDLLSRAIWGLRISLVVAFLSVGIAMLIGVPVGAVAGFFGGRVDYVLMRVVDLTLLLPSLLLAIALVAALGPSTGNIIAAISITLIARFARVMRSSVLVVKNHLYVEGAAAIGRGRIATLIRHVIPNSVGPLMAYATLNLGYAVLVEANLGFLGLGIQPPAPSLGRIAAEGLRFIQTAPSISAVGGISIMVLVLAANLTGDFLSQYSGSRSRA